MSLFAFRNGHLVPSYAFDKEEWVEVRKEARDGLVTLECGCPAVPAVLKWGIPKGSRITQYFRHRPSGGCGAGGSGGDSTELMHLKYAAGNFARLRGLEVGYHARGDGWRAGVLLTNPKTGGQAAIEIALSNIAPEEIISRTEAREESGLKVVWFFGKKDTLERLPESFVEARPCFLVKGERIHDMATSLENQLDIYLKGRAVYDDVVDLEEVPAELVMIPGRCVNCGHEFTFLQGAVLYPNRLRGNIEPRFVRTARWTIPHWMADAYRTASKKEPAKFGRLGRHMGEKGQVWGCSCPKCDTFIDEYALRTATILQHPGGPETTGDYLEIVQWYPRPCDIVEAGWRKRQDPPREGPRVTIGKWNWILDRVRSLRPEHKEILSPKGSGKAKKSRKATANKVRAARRSGGSALDLSL